MLQNVVEAGPRIGAGLVVAALCYLAGVLCGAWVRRRWCRLNRPSFANVMSRVARLFGGLLAMLAFVTVVFPTVKPVNVLGSLGFFSIAIGFAFRDILENLLAGMLLLFRAPFRMGDEVEVDGTAGTVQEINLRETVVRTYDGRRVLIPNATVYKNQLVVATGFDATRSEAVVGISYDAELDRAREVALSALAESPVVRQHPAPLVLVGELSRSTVDLHLLFWSDAGQLQSRMVRDRALVAVKEALQHAGIDMPADIVVVEGTTSLRDALQGALHVSQPRTTRGD
jgi:small conductance mechanosensitive channel